VKSTVLWAVLAVCGILLVGTLSQAWSRHAMEAQAAAARAQAAKIQQTLAQTQQAVSIASQPATIEREARRWGYIRQGDQPVIVVTPASATP